MKYTNLPILMIPLLLAALPVRAESVVPDDKNDKEECKHGDCKKHEPPRKICLNVFCTYQEDGPKGKFDKCEAGAVFEKWVTAEGKEIWDNSEAPFNPQFEVSCDKHTIFNDSGHRYTDYQGTRIQALQGPFPAILLPKGVLKDGHRYAPSALELANGHSIRGYCFIYTGQPLL